MDVPDPWGHREGGGTEHLHDAQVFGLVLDDDPPAGQPLGHGGSMTIFAGGSS